MPSDCCYHEVNLRLKNMIKLQDTEQYTPNFIYKQWVWNLIMTSHISWEVREMPELETVIENLDTTTSIIWHLLSTVHTKERKELLVKSSPCGIWKIQRNYQSRPALITRWLSFELHLGTTGSYIFIFLCHSLNWFGSLSISSSFLV